jgi:hypothetical protein
VPDADGAQTGLSSLASVATTWGGLGPDDSLLVVTDAGFLPLAQRLAEDNRPFVRRVSLLDVEDAGAAAAAEALAPNDLLLVLIGADSFISKGYGRHYPPFSRPSGVVAKYAFVRPTITAAALAQGLNTPLALADGLAARYGGATAGSWFRVTAPGGTDLAAQARACTSIPYRTAGPGEVAYLPPAEVSWALVPGTATGRIVVDVTVGELRVGHELRDALGLVDQPVHLEVRDGKVCDIGGGRIAARLAEGLSHLEDSCREVIELGFGLSRMEPTGIIGIDESIAGTCHFGIGADHAGGHSAPIHLDMVLWHPGVEAVDAPR